MAALEDVPRMTMNLTNILESGCVLVPEQIGKIPEKSGKSQKGRKRTKKEGRVQIGKPRRLKRPRLAALDLEISCEEWIC